MRWFAAALLFFLPGLSQAAEVLAKRIDSPDNGNLFAGNQREGGGDGRDNARYWAPGFRTVSYGTACFVTGWQHPPGDGDDGFITKLDVGGGILWTKRMKDIFGFRMRINDAEADSSRLYICGQDQYDRAFIASITHEGSAVDYSLIQGNAGGVTARASSLALTTINNSPVLTVGGDASGSGLKVTQRVRTAPSDVFTDLKLFQNKRDNFVVQFNTGLQATWGTTLGFPWGDDYVTAVTADPTGAVFVASAHSRNADVRGGSYYRECDNDDDSVAARTKRKVYSGGASGDWNERDDLHPQTYTQSDFFPGNFAMLWRVNANDGTQARITHYLALNSIHGTEEQDSEGRITDLSYQNGAIYAAGEWRKYLRPGSFLENGNGKFRLKSAESGGSPTWDIWTSRLSATNLDASAWQIFRSAGEDYVTQLTAAPDGVYLAGVAGGTLETFKNYVSSSDGTLDPGNAAASKSQLGGSASTHLFWQKLGSSDLSPGWHVKPEEDGGSAIPSVQKFAGITNTDGKVVITGGWVGGTLSLGPLDKRVSMVDDGLWRGFAGFLKSDGTWLEQVSVNINSQFGMPSPHKGLSTVAGGVTITASVPPEIYEAAGGVIIDPQDAEGIRTRAITRRICTGYQFRNSTVNGTASTVTFVASADTELTFLWRTEHAVDVESDLSGTDGLTSTAAGNPTPAVQKHWIRENEQFTALIDGAESDITVPGVRWRSIGFQVQGCVATAQGVADGDVHLWPAYQQRQQSAKITVGSPGKIVWKWAKEYSFRVNVNSAVATSAPSSSWTGIAGAKEYYIPWEATVGGIVYFSEPSVMLNLGSTRRVSGVQFKMFPTGGQPASVRIEGGSSWSSMNITRTVTVPAVPRGETIILQFPVVEAQYFRVVGLNAGGGEIYDSLDQVQNLVTTTASGAGEFWAPPGSGVTASSPATVSSGISALALKGYTGGMGAVTPFDQRSVFSKTFTLNEPSAITWDYARAIYPETVLIGQPVTFTGVTGVDATNVNRAKAPLSGTVQAGPEGSGFNDMMAWDAAAAKAIATRPGKFTVEFENTAAANDPAQNVIVEVTSVWGPPDYNHILETPAVDLDPDAADSLKFLRLAYSEGRARLAGTSFTVPEPGRSVLVFSQRTGGTATGNLLQEPLAVKVVNTLPWAASAQSSGSWALPATIGEELTSPAHETAVGHNGYILGALAPVNATVHDLPTSIGPIFPVNENFPDTGRWSSGRNPAHTRLLAGRIIELESAQDLLLNPATVKVAVALNGDSDRTVNGVLFQTDGASSATGGTVTANGVSVTTSASDKLDNWPAPILTGPSASSLGEIMRDLRYSNAPGLVQATIAGLTPGLIYNIQLLTKEGLSVDRRFDITVNDLLAVDNYTSTGHSAGHRWTGNHAYAWSAEYIAPADGTLRIKLARQLAGDPATGADNNPILNALIVHEVNAIQSAGAPLIAEPGTLAVAWYKLRDGIRWPWTAARYTPQWPAAPPRIVTASRLGSEGMAGPPIHDTVGAPYIMANVSSGSPVWNRPALDKTSLSGQNVHYAVAVIRPDAADQAWILAPSWDPMVFIYGEHFDPVHPLENLIHTASVTTGEWRQSGAIEAGRLYHVVVSQRTSDGSMGEVNLDPDLGALVYPYQQNLTGPAFSDPVIYHQAQPDAPGYNPNEEHSLIAPSFLDPARSAAFALRADLNRTARDADFTSQPHTLVQYTDKTVPASPVVKMAVFSIADEDSSITDPRLPAYNQQYTWRYQGEAGQRMLPPWPLDVVIGPSAWPEETNAENVDGRIAYHEDKKHNAWLVSGDTDPAEDIRAELYYPIRADFWHPTLATGTAIPLGHLPGNAPVHDILYNTIWPADVAVLKAGETLTFSGGEYVSDGGPAPEAIPILQPTDAASSATVNSFYVENDSGPQGANKTIDNNPATKYAVYGGGGTGIKFSPAAGATVVRQLSLTSANDLPGRDPTSYVLQGSNLPSPILNTWHSDWTTITQGPVTFTGRLEKQTFQFSNATAYLHYRIIFPTIAGDETHMQIAEISLDQIIAGPAVRPKGLPGAVAWQTGKQLFDSANPTMNAADTGSKYMARVFPALSKREVPLALTSLPDELKPASGNVIVEGLTWRFKKLPASLQSRVYYDASSQKLGFRGYLNGKTLGDSDLLATPGAQTILLPNVLTEADNALVGVLAPSAPEWVTAVGNLGTLTRSPDGASASASLGIGLVPAPGGALPATAFGPGLAVVTNPDLHLSGTASTMPDGYITIAENDDISLGDAPVAIHIIKVSRQKYRGSIAVLKPDNVFDEKLSLRHTADFGGDVNDLFFEWFYREEDGRDLNPPGVSLPTVGTPTGADWTVFASGVGKNEIQLSGAGPATLADNVFYVRYRHRDDGGGWSAWAGAANSREPNLASAAVTQDIAYVAQLAPGWIKRVTDGVNLFDARITDFRNNNAPATYTSMLQQAGQRWEGPVAFNPQKDAIENFGLIELYQTVLDRGMDLSVDLAPGTNGVNTALLNAANRIAGLYTLMGNEAMADAADPTVGFSTVGGQFGHLAPVLHSFRNQTGNLLQEELALLRGRGEVGARPAYNRLLWNFTNGEGEAAYVMNYGISDLNNDGFLTDVDARRLYPQGHGDAWGHYTMALKGYYDLATLNNFSWISRSEKYVIDGIVLDVDYLDERAFAKTAAARAQCGAQLVDLAYRQAYTDNPNGQWQGYRDTNTDRAWGVFETAQRTGTGALCDWLTASAMLKGEETDPAKTGIRKVDRTTVGELKLIAAQAAAIQSKLDSADHGMNPAGLDPDMVPFDIDPVLNDRSNQETQTHFEQIFTRAVASNRNALMAFNHASEAGILVRQTAASTEELRKETFDQDLAYRNQLIEYFGTPYQGTMGASKAYPEGYNGPDLYLFTYMDRTNVGGDLAPALETAIFTTNLVPGLRNLANDTNPFQSNNRSVHDLLKETVSSYFPNDGPMTATPGTPVTLNLPKQLSGYALVAPDGWGQRRSPGKIQAAMQELLESQWAVRTALYEYTGMKGDFEILLRKFEIKTGIMADKLTFVEKASGQRKTLRTLAGGAFGASLIADQAKDFISSLSDTAITGLPTVVGLATDAAAPARVLIETASSIPERVLNLASGAAQAAQYGFEIAADEVMADLDKNLFIEDSKAEVVDMLAEIQQLMWTEGSKLNAIVSEIEAMRSAAYRLDATLQEGLAIVEQRTVFNRRVAATTTQQRYEDFTFRVTHSEALRKYQTAFDLAGRYAYLAGKAYAYELNLPDNHAANAAPLLSEMLRTRSLGEWDDTEPVIGQGGIAEQLAILKTNFDTLKGQLGFNNPVAEVNDFSIRAELGRVGLSSRVNADWRTKLETWRVPDLWNFQYQNNGVNYGYIFRRYCRPFAPEAAGAQPALVIPFDSHIAAGKNWFGKTLAGGDSSFNASNFSTKIRSAGIRLDGYNNTAMSQTPQAYLIPVGMDRMFLPDSTTLADRSWNVVDQRIPVPISISPGNLADPAWQPFTGSASGFFEEIRKFSSFRAYHDAGGYSPEEVLSTNRLVGRSAWNTQWVLIIPSNTLLNDPANSSAGIDTFIYGAPLPGFTQATAGTVNRDLIGARDIRILLQTYSISGN